MTKDNPVGACVEADCDELRKARGLCNKHYLRRRAAGTLPPQQLSIPIGKHALLNIDREHSRADCSNCGPDVPVRIRDRSGGRGGGIECRSSRRRSEQRKGKPRPTYGRGPVSASARRAWRLKARYGMSVSDYEQMYLEQGGRCAICDTAYPTLCIDHCHKTGRVRGLLCTQCNTGVGHLRDSVPILNSAIRYLSS